MNNEKICFITCVNNERAYQECVFYINNLNVPPNLNIEIMAVRNALSMTSAYNKIMNLTDAKYKVYLHQDTFIINKDFITDVLKIFEDIKVGMIGVVGADEVPKDGVWWNCDKKIGKIYDSHSSRMNLQEFGSIEEHYRKIKVIDGLIMITQYDIFWREDVFSGWHFYDLSHSMEFIKQGYDVVVCNQQKPWCIHDCGIVNLHNGFNENRLKFIEIYT
ncbi:glycosyltransferase family protein [Clostridioides difficile]